MFFNYLSRLNAKHTDSRQFSTGSHHQINIFPLFPLQDNSIRHASSETLNTFTVSYTPWIEPLGSSTGTCIIADAATIAN